MDKDTQIQQLAHSAEDEAALIARVLAKAKIEIESVQLLLAKMSPVQAFDNTPSAQPLADNFDNLIKIIDNEAMTTFNSSQVAQNGDSNEAEDQMQEKDYTENFFKEVEVEINVNDDAAEGQIQNQASDIEQLQQINQPESKGVTKKNLKETLQEVAEEVIESEESPRKKLEEVLEKVVEREENSEKSVEEVAEEKVDSNLVICEFSNNDGNNEDAPIDSNQIVIQEVLDSKDNNVNLSAQESSEAIH
ncbi:MAG: hypothetical protein K9G11_03285 [Rickettsiaceae bacterium]|nr:hypothetical protein [Rickettsiaceae bacterium]